MKFKEDNPKKQNGKSCHRSSHSGKFSESKNDPCPPLDRRETGQVPPVSISRKK